MTGFYKNALYKKIYLEADSHINNQYSYLKNNTAQLYFILGTADLDLHWKFFHITEKCPGYSQISKSVCGQDPLPVEKSVNIRAILRYTGKISM